jgi:[3-methyl-2-oxobutanoate dehydrogenase (acetyl-transferring)] kinase
MLADGRAALSDPSGHLLLQAAAAAQADLPRRLARRLMDLQLLPHIVVANPHIRRVYDAYRHAFDTLTAFPPVRDAATQAAFSALLRRLVEEHAPMLDALAAGLREAAARPFTGPRLALDPFLDGMLRSRISRRVLAEHVIGLADRRPGHIGAVCLEVRVREAVEHAAARARQAASETYGCAPEVVVACSGGGGADPALPYIPAHLDYCLYELLKNAVRATVEAARPAAGAGGARSSSSSLSLPPVIVRVCDAPGGSTTVRISDQGGGLPVGKEEAVWRYGFSTVPEGGLEASGGVGGGGGASAPLLPGDAAAPHNRWRLGGLGFGLPLSRLYSRYFGGDVRLVNMRGYGVDAFLSVAHLGDGGWSEPACEAEGFAGAVLPAPPEGR